MAGTLASDVSDRTFTMVAPPLGALEHRDERLHDADIPCT